MEQLEACCEVSLVCSRSHEAIFVPFAGRNSRRGSGSRRLGRSTTCLGGGGGGGGVACGARVSHLIAAGCGESLDTQIALYTGSGIPRARLVPSSTSGKLAGNAL